MVAAAAVSPGLPAVKNQAWVRTPIDAFVLAAMEAKGLHPSRPAGKRTLLRRVTFDLIGLPPTPEEIDAFLADNRPDAYEKVVDRLLASPRYGERWGRHWLDVVHYADTHGYDKDKRRDHAWPYRDYVVHAFNSDKPYRDLLRSNWPATFCSPDDTEGVIATGFVVAGPWDFVGQLELREGTVDKEKTRVLDRDDMVINAISTFDSLTVHCARCHDHKFDPIPQKDYYRLQAVFAGVERADRPYGDKESLARGVPAGTSPSNGWHSGISATPDVEKWVQVDLGKSVAIDAFTLFPRGRRIFPIRPASASPCAFAWTLRRKRRSPNPRLSPTRQKATS